MKTFLSTMITALVVAGQAQALSCMPADAARSFNWASNAEERYVILQGAFSFDFPKTEPVEDINNPPTVVLQSQFNGKYLTPDGFIDAPPLDVTVEFTCLGPWCGAMEADENVLAFVEQADSGYILRVEPCFSTVLEPSDRNLARVTSCMRGTGCEEAAF